MGGQSIQLSPYYSLKVRNDSVYSYLPYYGRAYMLPYGGGEGLNFEAKVVDYKQEMGKKGSYEITFSARTQEDYYTFHVTVYDNGSSMSVKVAEDGYNGEVAIVGDYDYFPFVFDDGCVHFINGVL